MINKKDIFYKNYCPATFRLFDISATQNLMQSEVKHFPPNNKLWLISIPQIHLTLHLIPGKRDHINRPLAINNFAAWVQDLVFSPNHYFKVIRAACQITTTCYIFNLNWKVSGVFIQPLLHKMERKQKIFMCLRKVIITFYFCISKNKALKDVSQKIEEEDFLLNF